MRVVLFCGGLGMRLRDHFERTPKPLVEIGPRPILWHLMSYYAHFGHKDFVLCLGHGALAIKEYFLKYDETVSNDFVLSEGGKQIELLRRDIADWRITFVDTGQRASIGERLRAVRPHLAGEDVFLANYSDGLSDLDLDGFLDYFRRRGKIASFL
jgi:glucose-1-phosphate cytidylyltransferase